MASLCSFPLGSRVLFGVGSSFCSVARGSWALAAKHTPGRIRSARRRIIGSIIAPKTRIEAAARWEHSNPICFEGQWSGTMPVYQIHRLRESRRQQFRWAPHTSGISVAKPHDYEQDGSVRAETPYAAWLALRDTDRPLCPGDILGSESGELRIYKYVGFEEAKWFVPEPAPDAGGSASAEDVPQRADAAVQ